MNTFTYLTSFDLIKHLEKCILYDLYVTGEEIGL